MSAQDAERALADARKARRAARAAGTDPTVDLGAQLTDEQLIEAGAERPSDHAGHVPDLDPARPVEDRDGTPGLPAPECPMCGAIVAVTRRIRPESGVAMTGIGCTNKWHPLAAPVGSQHLDQSGATVPDHAGPVEWVSDQHQPPFRDQAVDRFFEQRRPASDGIDGGWLAGRLDQIDKALASARRDGPTDYEVWRDACQLSVAELHDETDATSGDLLDRAKWWRQQLKRTAADLDKGPTCDPDDCAPHRYPHEEGCRWHPAAIEARTGGSEA
jgi:hypothetical protein